MTSIRKLSMLATVVASLFLSSAAHAVVRYDFTAFGTTPSSTGESYSGSFTYIIPNFLDPLPGDSGVIKVPVSDLTSCMTQSSQGNQTNCFAPWFYRDYPDALLDSAVVQFGVQRASGGATGYFYYFAPDAFTTPGTYDSMSVVPNQSGRLVVTNLGSAVPEPATWGMMIIGFGLIGAAFRATHWRNRLSVSPSASPAAARVETTRPLGAQRPPLSF